MPKIVDHDLRRKKLAAIAAHVIAERGIENTRLRDVANEAGFSTSIVCHYYDNKDELMLSALAYVDELVAVRFAILRNRSISKALETILPLDDQRRMEWRVRINFWGRATIHTGLAQTLSKSLDFAQTAMVQILQEQIELGKVNSEIDVKTDAELLVNATISLSLRILFQPEMYTQKRIKILISELVERLG